MWTWEKLWKQISYNASAFSWFVFCLERWSQQIIILNFSLFKKIIINDPKILDFLVEKIAAK